MPAFHQSPRLRKLDVADARWLRSLLSETFPDGLAASPLVILSRLAAALEQVPAEGDHAWFRASLLQEIYRGLCRYTEAVRSGEQAYRIRPWDPRSTYALALTYQELSHGRVEGDALLRAISGLPLRRPTLRDSVAVERALAELDLTEERAALRALQLFQATLAFPLHRNDRRRVQNGVARLVQDWPTLQRARKQGGAKVDRLAGGKGQLAALRQDLVAVLCHVADSVPVLVSAIRAWLTAFRPDPQNRRWRYGAAAMALVLLLAGLGGLTFIASNGHPPGVGGPGNAAAIEDPTTELLVVDQEGYSLDSPLTLYRDSPFTIIVTLINRSDAVRRYELSVRIDNDEWPLGAAEVTPAGRWEGGFQVTLSQPPRNGIEVLVRDAGTQSLVRSRRFVAAVQEALVSVPATPEVSPTPDLTPTPEPTAPSPLPSPAQITSIGAATLSTEPRVLPPAPPPLPTSTGPAPAASTPPLPTTTGTAVPLTPTPGPTLPAVLPTSAAVLATPVPSVTVTPPGTVHATATVMPSLFPATTTVTPRPSAPTPTTTATTAATPSAPALTSPTPTSPAAAPSPTAVSHQTAPIAGPPTGTPTATLPER